MQTYCGLDRWVSDDVVVNVAMPSQSMGGPCMTQFLSSSVTIPPVARQARWLTPFPEFYDNRRDHRDPAAS